MAFTCRCNFLVSCLCFFFFNDTATTEIYTLSLHDALPISIVERIALGGGAAKLAAHERAREETRDEIPRGRTGGTDRKSTRLNSSHSQISYAVFCLKKKENESRKIDDAPPLLTLANLYGAS